MWIKRIGYTFLVLSMISAIGYVFSLKNSHVNVDYIVFTWLGVVFLVLSLIFIVIGINQKPIAPEVLIQREKDKLTGSQNYRIRTNKIRKTGLIMLITPLILLFLFVLAQSGIWVGSNPLVLFIYGIIGDLSGDFSGFGAALTIALTLLVLGILCGISVLLGLVLFFIASRRESKSKKVQTSTIPPVVP